MFFRFSNRKSWQEKTIERVFKDRKLREERLIPFGCTKMEHGFRYRAELLGGKFCMEFEIQTDGSVSVTVHGDDREETDMLRQLNKTPATFMDRQLRKEYEEELWHVAECCFDPDSFKNEITQRVIEHIRTTYGDEPEFLWRKTPRNAIVRRKDNNKWYAALLAVPQSKLVGSSDKIVEILNLRVHPQELESIVDNQNRFPGYHMNKKNWVTLPLDGSVPFEELAKRIETSYQLALK